ncbi:MAG: hypothetical protein ACOYXN_09320 [Acidobacteriota bacterium]
MAGTKAAGLTAAAVAAAGWALWIAQKGPSAPVVPPSGFYDALVLAGAPAVLLLAVFLGVRWPRETGVLLLLGASLASLGVGLRPGVYARDFFLAFSLTVLPSLLAGALLMAAGRSSSSVPPRPRPGAETKRAVRP